MVRLILDGRWSSAESAHSTLKLFEWLLLFCQNDVQCDVDAMSIYIRF